MPPAFGIAAVFANAIGPETGGSPNADNTHTLWVIVLIIALIVLVGVEGLLLYTVIRFRARKHRVAAQIHGNTRLEIGWTVGAAVVLVFITVVTFIKLPGIKNPAASNIDAQGNPVAANAYFAATDQKQPPKGAKLHIVVDGQQYVWRYQYPPQGDKIVYAYEEMVVPVGMTVTLDITSDDVAHSWWIPDLGGKAGAVGAWFKRTFMMGLKLL
jgi:cytochrome c oxidase subunit 2